MDGKINEISWKIHHFVFQLAINKTNNIGIDGILKDLIQIRKHDKSIQVSNLIKLVLAISSPQGELIDSQTKLQQLASKINGVLRTSWIDSLPLPLPSSNFKDVELPNKMIRQMKLPDCSLIAVINAILFGKNNVDLGIIIKESVDEICCVFHLNGSPKVIITPNELDTSSMCNMHYGRAIEKAYFSMLGYYCGNDITKETQSLKADFKGADFTDVGMELLGFIPLPRPMVLACDQWDQIYDIWSNGNCIVGLGTSNFFDIKRIKLTNGNPYIIIPNHDYPLINIIKDIKGEYIFEVFDGLKLIEFKISDLIHFNILSINLKPMAVHSTEAFIVSETSWLEFTIKSPNQSPFFIVLERHLPKSRDLATICTENLMLYETTHEHSGVLWQSDNLLKNVRNISRFSVLECTAESSQLCIDLKSIGNNLMYTLHFFSEINLDFKRVKFDDLVIKKGRFNNKGRLNLFDNPSWEFLIGSQENAQYININVGVLIDGNTDDEVNINIFDGKKLMYDQSYQKSKQFKLAFLQTNKKYKLIVSSFQPSFSKFKIISDMKLLLTE